MTRRARDPRFDHEGGLTLVELMVAISIFVMLGLMLMIMTKDALDMWRTSEHRRRAYESSQLVFSRLSEDLSASFTREPLGLDEVKARFLVDGMGENGTQRLMFVRTIEAGPERTVTYFSGSGGSEYYNLFDDNKDGKVDNNLRPLGGLAEVVYFVKGTTLYRGVRSPVGESPVEIVDSGLCVPLAENVLYFGVSLWTQYTNTWDESAKPTRKATSSRGAERIWDSTRGYAQLKGFLLHRGQYSLAVSEDDVFPEKVRVTLALEGDETEHFTTLTDGTTDADIMIRVASSQGFPSPEEGRPTFVRVRKEWIKYRQKARRHFVVDENGRGARGTVAASHPKGARVRVGHTFSIVTYVPTYKEDWSDDQEAARRAGVRYVPR